MKIGIYDPYLNDLGGGEKYMMTIAECLSKNNTVTVFWNEKTVVKDLQTRFSIDLSRVIFSENIFSPEVSLYRKMRESKKFDIIILLSDGSLPFLLSKKTILHIQQPLPVVSLKLLDRIKLKRIASIFCNSEFTKDYIDKRYLIKSSLLYPPILLKPQKIKKENIILHVGRFRVQISGSDLKDYKKQKEMIHAFCEMVKRERLKGWKFVVCTSVKDEDKNNFELLKKSVEGYPVEFAVNKSNEELWNYYSKAKIYWHASGFGEDLQKNPELAEHFGISTVEAMGAGVVPVVINKGGQKEIVQDGINGITWDSLEELKRKTINLIQDTKKMEKLSNQARLRAKEFSDMNFCKSLNAILGL